MFIEGFSTRNHRIDCSRLTDKQLRYHLKHQKKNKLYKKEFIEACENELKKRALLNQDTEVKVIETPKKKKKKQAIKKKKKKQKPSQN